MAQNEQNNKNNCLIPSRLGCIIFTGGGSSGHVIPNLSLIEEVRSIGYSVVYVGSRSGIEKKIISKKGNIPYISISSGKFRRCFNLRNFVDPFRIIYGIIQSFFICFRIRPKLIFSKGGFVSFPVVVGAWLNRIPIVVHESDLSPGLANRLSFPFAKKICVTFDETATKLKNRSNVVVSGTPLRKEIFLGDAKIGLNFCKFSENKKVILVIGGSLGSKSINFVIRNSLHALIKDFQIVHICGEGKVDEALAITGYKQFEYIHGELPDIMSCADLIISRAGANSIYEFLALKKPNLLIPLPLNASRGDQIENARYFATRGLSEVIMEEDLSPRLLCEKITWMDAHREQIVQRLNTFEITNSVALICNGIIPSIFGLNTENKGDAHGY